MNGGLTGMEHEGESLMTSFSFLGELTCFNQKQLPHILKYLLVCILRQNNDTDNVCSKACL